MYEWFPISGSSRIVATAYDAATEQILVEFPDGIRWWYGECPALVWDEFMAPGTSKGQYIYRVLNHHPNGRLA